MVTVIILYIVWCICIFAIVYCHDKELIWHDLDYTSKNIHIGMPKLSDLLNSNDTIRQTYVDKVISPAYLYFALRDDLNKSNILMIVWR